MPYDNNQINIGVGLNQVDNLKPSKYFYEVIENSNSFAEIENKLTLYYKEKEKEINFKEKECDIVSIRIADLIN